MLTTEHYEYDHQSQSSTNPRLHPHSQNSKTDLALSKRRPDAALHLARWNDLSRLAGAGRAEEGGEGLLSSGWGWIRCLRFDHGLWWYVRWWSVFHVLQRSVHKTMLHVNYTNSYVEFGSGFGALERVWKLLFLFKWWLSACGNKMIQHTMQFLSYCLSTGSWNETVVFNFTQYSPEASPNATVPITRM